MKSYPTRTRRSLPTRRVATIPMLLAAALIASACSDDDPDVAEPVVLEEPDRTMSEDDPTVVEEPITEGPVTEKPPVTVATEQRDRPGLTVRFPADADPDTLSSPWLAVIDVFQNAAFPDTTGDLYVELIRYSPALTFESHVDFYTPELDTCFIPDPSDDDDGGDEEDVDDGKRSVNGGDAALLSSAGGTWLSVPYSLEERAYDHDDEGFPGVVPDDLTLSLSGAEFPAIDSLPIEAPAAPVRLSPAIGEAITPATEYRWQPTDDGSIVRLVFKQFIDGEFDRFTINCRVEDDGEFELPADVLEALAQLPGESTVRLSREINTVEFRDGIVIYRSVDIVDD